jgi:hypothetical protein
MREEAFIAARREVAPLDTEALADHLARALSRDHWRALCPALAIESTRAPAAIEARALGDEERARMRRSFDEEGWFRADPFLDPTTVEAMRRAIVDLVAAGWPPVFAYVYDAFWEIQRAPSIRRFVTEALGAGYRQSPRVWAFCVPAKKGASGWPPHVDGGAGTHTHDRLTLWIPLGDATLENGCMYLVPKSALPATIADDFASAMGDIEAATWRAMLQASRALPVRAGALLGWDFQVIHWSSLAGDAEAPVTMGPQAAPNPAPAKPAPRVSLAVECFGPHITPTPSEEPRIDPEGTPTFEARLLAIARGLLSYERFEPPILRFRGLGRALLDRLELGAELV